MEAIATLSKYSQSQEFLHSSQLPPEKPHLTKGVTVDNIVKRLSTERYPSPSPQIVQGGFSYTRPNEQPIVYAQVVCSDPIKEKQTLKAPNLEHIKTFSSQTTNSSSSPTLKMNRNERIDSYLNSNGNLKNYSDEDEGVALDDHSKSRYTSVFKQTTIYTGDEDIKPIQDSPITPKLKYTPPEKLIFTPFSSKLRGQADGKEFFPEFSELSQRRAILESRIRSRIGSRDLLDHASPDREYTPNRYENTFRKSTSVERTSHSPVRNYLTSKSYDEDLIAEKNAKNQYVESFVKTTVVKKDGKPFTAELTERYRYPNDPLEKVKTTKTTYVTDEYGEQKHHTENHHHYKVRHVDKGDSGIENDFRKDSFNKNDIPKLRMGSTQIIQSTKNFLRHERQHTNDVLKKRRKTPHRERSIDDGSRYDPRIDRVSSHSRSKTSTMKHEKKSGGLQRVKEFIDATKKMLVGGDKHKDHKRGSASDDEVKKRYREYGGNNSRFGRNPDIANRRRLSTPKSSPTSAKRSMSFKSSRLSSTLSSDNKSSKSDWFKSFDRLSRKKSNSKTQVNKTTEKPTKSLRFFGDTDNEYIDRVPKRPTRHLNKSEKKYQSAYDLDILPKISENHHRSSSMQNLDVDQENDMNETNTKNYNSYQNSTQKHYRSRDYAPPDSDSRISYSRSRENSLDRVEDVPKIGYSKTKMLAERNGGRDHLKPPTGPQKPARAFERRKSPLREHDRLQDSSGTEGESSRQSDRSIVYLHATTVGDIPHPHIANTRQKAFSREDLQSKKMQPQERTLSRSISVLAPWKPRLIREGYEIDYNEKSESRNNPRQSTTLPRSLKNRSSSQSTLTRKTKSRSKNTRDEIDSDKSSSFDNSRLSYTNYRGSTSTLPTAGRKAREVSAASSRTNTLNSKYRRS